MKNLSYLLLRRLRDDLDPSKEGLYLPGLAAGGVQFQDKYGKISHPGTTNQEIKYLAEIPKIMCKLLEKKLPLYFPSFDKDRILDISYHAVLDTELSPTINLNKI